MVVPHPVRNAGFSISAQAVTVSLSLPMVSQPPSILSSPYFKRAPPRLLNSIHTASRFILQFKGPTHHKVALACDARVELDLGVGSRVVPKLVARPEVGIFDPGGSKVEKLIEDTEMGDEVGLSGARALIRRACERTRASRSTLSATTSQGRSTTKRREW